VRSQLIDKSTAELLGRLALQERVIAELVSRLEEQDRRIVEMERRLSRAVSPSQMLSEARAAELLDLSVQTLARWRKSPRPPIPMLAREGVIRYRLEDVERFIREGTRGARTALKAA
jgi:Helix-turn-helix domain